jgi:hypothetical protein
VPHVGGTFHKTPLDSPHELGNNAFKLSPMIFPRNLVQNAQERKKKIKIRVMMVMENYFSKGHKEEGHSNNKQCGMRSFLLPNIQQ